MKDTDTAKSPMNVVARSVIMVITAINATHTRAARMEIVNDHGNVTASE